MNLGNIIKQVSNISIRVDGILCNALSSPSRLLSTTSTLHRVLDNRLTPRYPHPSKTTGRWIPKARFEDTYAYTTDPLPMPRNGGRGPNGRIWTHRKGGGREKVFYMIDHVRGGPTSGPPLQERVKKIISDQNRSSNIALVASGDHKRWLLATQNMKTGDLISSSRVLSKTAVRAAEGDSYPIGSLPIGTLMNSVELFPGQGGHLAKAAGTTAMLLRKVDGRVVVRMPSKREVSLDENCVATVGRVSNVNHNKRILGKAGASRWLGIRPKSGRWHRKGGRFGRKIRPIKKMITHTTMKVARDSTYKMYSQ